MSVNRIAISGKICSGKTTVSDYLKDNYGFTQIRSAEFLKKICSTMAKINLLSSVSSANQTATASLYNILDNYIRYISKNDIEYNKVKEEITRLHKEFSHIKDASKKTDDVREMLQVVANELIEKVRQDIWVSSTIKYMKELELTEGVTKFVHDDMRYPFEYDALRKEGFVLIRLNISKEIQLKRIKKLYGKIKPERLEHISETALDRALFDYEISSDQPLPDMLLEIKKIICSA